MSSPPLTPPARFAHSTFESYQAHESEPSQHQALLAAREFVSYLQDRQHTRRGFLRRLRQSQRHPWMGLYLVGPVGTGKTHLLVSMYHALEAAGIPCAFLHSSELFRATTHPETYARGLAERCRVLCIDEVELDDPGNAARFSLVLDALNRLGVFILATSNVEPEQFTAGGYENEEFYRMMTDEFRRRYRVVFVGGQDYRKRLPKTGHAWIGPAARTRALMRRAYEADPGRKKWLEFDELIHAATEIERTALVRRLVPYDSLYLADLAVGGTDDALRLLRIIDDLYLAPAPPTLFFTSETGPEAWFSRNGARGGREQEIADKFTRTTSRLSALCKIEHLPPVPAHHRG